MKLIISTVVAFASLASVAFSQVVGQAAPDFTLTTADGKEVSLSELKGKEVVLEWTNPGCPFVKKHYNEGHMQKLQKEYADKGVAWLLISSANKEHATFLDAKALEANAKARNAAATYALVDADAKVGKAYAAKTTPHMFVINKEGVLAYAGAIDSNSSSNTKDIATSENYVVAALDALQAGEKVKTAETKAYGCSVKY